MLINRLLIGIRRNASADHTIAEASLSGCDYTFKIFAARIELSLSLLNVSLRLKLILLSL